MNVIPFIQREMELLISEKSLLQNGMKYWKFYERVFDNISFSVSSAFNFHNSVY